MKTFLTALLVATVVLVSNTANAQTPWSCSGRAIGTYNPGSNTYNDNTKLYSAFFDAAGDVTYTDKPATEGIGLNAIGFRKQDNFVYGVRYTQANGSANELCRIDSNGTIVSLGKISGLPANIQYYAGAFNRDGFLYVSSGTGAAPYRLYKIDVTSLTAYEVGTIGNNRLIDLAFDPLTDSLYASSANDNNNGGNLLKIDVSASPIVVTTVGTMDVFMFGLFFIDDAQLYGFGRNSSNNTAYYKIDKKTGATIEAGAGPSATNADACSCPFRLSHSLSVSNSSIKVGENVDLTVAITNLSSGIQDASFYLTLDKSLSFSETAAQIQSKIQSLFPGSTAIVNISSSADGSNNIITINTIHVPITTTANPVIPFTLSVQVNTVGFTKQETVSLQSVIDVPGNDHNTGKDYSDNPLTAQLDDATLLTISPAVVATVMPVTVTDLKAELNDKNADITWTSRQEINTSKFEVEKSTDGTHFTTVGEVAAKGSMSSATNYNFTDVDAVSNDVTYYRLKMVDNNGASAYTTIVSLKASVITGAVSVYPSLFKDNVTVSVYAQNEAAISINVVDLTGRTVSEKVTDLNRGTNTIHVTSLGSLSQGVYFVKIYSGSDLLQTQKIIKGQ